MGIYQQKTPGPNGTHYGTLVIDRVILGKRVKISTGSTDRKTVEKMNDLIDELVNRGMDHHLRNLSKGRSERGRISIRQLYELYLRGKLYDPFHDPEIVQTLKPTLNEWVETYKNWSDKTRQGNKELLSTMFKKIGTKLEDPLIEDIPKILRIYRDICEKDDHPRQFNLIRSVLHRFIRLRFGKTSHLYTQTSDVEKLPDRPKNPQTAKSPGQIERLCRALPEKYRGMVWTMCTTGVGWTEYGQMTARADIKNPRVYIEGTKTDKKDERRKREVPLVFSPTPRVGSEKQFRKILSSVSKKLKMDNVRIYTLRKCYSNWLSESGVPLWRVEMYMGHLPKSQTQKYQTTDTYLWLIEDGEKLKKYIEENRTKIGRKEKVES
jgi:integrase